MKSIVFILLAVLIGTNQAQDPLPSCPDPNYNNWLSLAIIEALSIVKPCISTGIPSMGLPPLDPFEIPTINVTYNDHRIKADGSIRGATINNLADLYFCEMTVNFGILSHKLLTEIRIDTLNINGIYNFAGLFCPVGPCLIPFHGSGLFGMNVNGVSLILSGKLKLSGFKYLYKLTDLEVSLKYESLEAKLDCDSNCIIYPGGHKDMEHSLAENMFHSIEEAVLPEIKSSLGKILNTVLSDLPLYSTIGSKEHMDIGSKEELLGAPCIFNIGHKLFL